MTRKEQMIAAFTEAQEQIALALKALETAGDDGRGQTESEHPFFDGTPTDDAQIAARAAYHTLRPIAYPPSTDPLDAIEVTE